MEYARDLMLGIDRSLLLDLRDRAAKVIRADKDQWVRVRLECVREQMQAIGQRLDKDQQGRITQVIRADKGQWVKVRLECVRVHLLQVVKVTKGVKEVIIQVKDLQGKNMPKDRWDQDRKVQVQDRLDNRVQ